METKGYKDYIILASETIIAVALACFNNEIKELIMEKWQLILFIICISAIYFTICKIYINHKISDLDKGLGQLLSIYKIEKTERELSDKILKNMIDYNTDCLNKHASDEPIKEYNPLYTGEVKRLHKELKKEIIKNSL